MSSNYCGPHRLVPGSLAFILLVAACAAPDRPGEPGPVYDPDVVGVSLSLTVVQPDAKCLRATFTGATTTIRTAAPAAGSTAPIILTGLPVGTFSLLVEAFNLACASVVATTPVSWTSDPVTVVLATSTLTPVTVTLKRPASSAVSVDFDTSQLFQGPSAAGGNPHELAVLDNSLYVARNEIERMPITGGNVDSTLQALTSRMVVGTSGVFYSTIFSPSGSFWVPPGQPLVRMSNRVPFIMAAIPGGYIESNVADNSMLNTGTIFRVNTAGVSTPLATGFPNGSLLLPILATDGTTVFYAFPTGAPVSGGVGDQTVVGKIPVAGGSATTLASFAPPVYAVDITTDGAFAYVAERSTTPTLNGIFRVPAAGGAPVPVALIPAGVPVKVLVDATNVYYITSVLDNLGGCDSGSISRVAKAGGTPTPLWSSSNVCPHLLAQSPTWLFFDVGANVHRLDK